MLKSYQPRFLVGSFLLLALPQLQCGGLDPAEVGVKSERAAGTSQALADVTYSSGHTRDGWILLSWGTRSETDCAGFNVLRRPTGEGDFVPANAELIPAKDPAGADYEYEDRPLAVGTYDYQLEEIDTHGVSTVYGQFTVSVFSDGDDGDGGTSADDDSGSDSVDRGLDLGCAAVGVPADSKGGFALVLLVAVCLMRRTRRSACDPT